MKPRKPTNKQKYQAAVRAAAEQDQRRQQQVANQINAIERLMAVNVLLTEFIEERGLSEDWAAWRDEQIEKQRQEREAGKDGESEPDPT